MAEKNLDKMTTEELQARADKLAQQQRALRAEQLGIIKILDARRARASALRKLSPAERAALENGG